MARQASPLTVAIRQLLEQHNGKLTASEATVPLKNLGFESVDQVFFNQVKNTWINRKKEAAALAANSSKVAKANNKKSKKAATVTEQESLDFVIQNGGLKTATALVNRQIQLINTAKKAIAALA